MGTPPRGGSRRRQRDRVGTALIVYALEQYPLRTTVRDHLYSFARWSRMDCAYVNLQVRRPERVLSQLRPDVIVFDTTFLSSRWDLSRFEWLVDRAAPLRDDAAVKVAIPQDEMLRPDLLCRFIAEFGIAHVLTILPEHEVPVVYRTVDRDKVGFDEVLTGYLEHDTIARIDRILERSPQRLTDIGYRAWEGGHWLGRLGFTKGELARLFTEAAAGTGLSLDISTRPQDTFRGDAWYEFLASCKYTIGVEGGASLFDWDGTIRARIDSYLERSPAATFEEVERACFPGQDNSLNLRAITPRHLESCATRTCQILLEGEYNGILRPGEHYIPLRADYGNLDEVIAAVRSDTVRDELTSAAHRDVVASGRYSYQQFVATFDNAVHQHVSPSRRGRRAAARIALADAQDRASWLELARRLRWAPVATQLYPAIGRRLPGPVRDALRTLRGRGLPA
jgi:hypothetical protein